MSIPALLYLREVEFDNRGKLTNEFPELHGETLYLDMETSSGDSGIASTNPWKHCRPVGLVVGDAEKTYYLPSTEKHLSTLQKILPKFKRIVGHNLKYDLHVLANAGIEFPDCLDFVDTRTTSKIIDSDRFDYSQEKLALDWLGDNIAGYREKMNPFLRNPSGSWKCKDYGQVPIDILAEYGCEDVNTLRKLHKHIRSRLPTECKEIYDMEVALTKELFNVERTGICIDLPRVATDGLRSIPKLLERLALKVTDRTGKAVIAGDSKGYDELFRGYGFQPIEFTDSGAPSYGLGVLQQYYALASDSQKPIILDIIRYKKWEKILTAFTQPYIKLQVDGYLHGSYNQLVRTGRMSCTEPNMQQLPPYVRNYIIPEPKHEILSIDLSQIEFRTIIHYISDARCTKDYIERPDTDFHTWVANMCGIDRRPAKTCNFLTGYGGGKKRLKEELDKFGMGHLAEEVHDAYHAALPTLKPTMARLAKELKRMGYVETLFGRRRHLPLRIRKKSGQTFDNSYKAFNSVCQGTAADMMKAITLRIATLLKKYNTKLIAIVHDEWVFQMPVEEKEEIIPALLQVIEERPEDFTVPIKADYSSSSINWRYCK